MNAHSKANPKAHHGSRNVAASPEGRSGMSGLRTNGEMDDQIVELEYDDGYPAGFTILDNRDIWQGQERFQQLTFPLKTIGALGVLASFPPGWVNNVRHLRRVLGVGRDQLRTILAELEEKGRLKRIQVRNPDGTYGRQRWVLRRGGPRCSPPSTPPEPDSQAPVETDDWKAGDGPATETQASASTGACKAVDGLPGAGIPGPLVTTEVVLNTEASTTTSPALPAAPELVPPPSLPPGEAQVVVAEVQKAMRSGDLRADLAQPILDELEGAVRRGQQGQRGRRIEKPVSYLRSLLRRAETDQFCPEAGLPIARERQRQVLETENRVRRAEQRRQQQAVRDDPETRRWVRQHLADFSRTLGMPQGSDRDPTPQRMASVTP